MSEKSKVRLVLMQLPFGSVSRPAIGLSQLRSHLRKSYGGELSVEIVYANMDFSGYLGADFYRSIAESMDHHTTGLGDWLFRQVAFPHLADNTQAYFQRCYPHASERNTRLRRLVLEKRSGLEGFLESLIDSYHLDTADMVGFSSTFAQNVAALAMARLLKKRNDKVITIMGGANCESVMGQTIARNFQAVDFVFSGPALISLPRFVDSYLKGDFESMHDVRGVFSRRNQTPSPLAVLGSKPVAGIGEELDINTPVELDYSEYLTKWRTSGNHAVRPYLLFETSRGCWWGEKAHCTFCGLNGETMSFKSMRPELAIATLESLFRYAHTCGVFESVDNIMPRSYVQDVFARVSAPANTRIFYEVKADLSEADLAILSKAGVKLIQPGIESLATSTLRLMKKGTTATQNIQFLRGCVTTGILPAWNLLVGFPGETEDVYRLYCTVLDSLTHLCPPSGVFPVRFDRFSPYFTRAQEYGLKLEPVDYYALTYPLSRDDLSQLAYYFADKDACAPYFVAMVKWLGKMRVAVEKWRRLWDKTQPNWSQPKLYFTNGKGGEIIDSRTGQIQIHDVGPFGRDILESLYKPKGLPLLEAEFPQQDFAVVLKTLEDRKLVFREGDRLIGVVCPCEPPPTPFRDDRAA